MLERCAVERCEPDEALAQCGGGPCADTYGACVPLPDGACAGHWVCLQSCSGGDLGCQEACRGASGDGCTGCLDQGEAACAAARCTVEEASLDACLVACAEEAGASGDGSEASCLEQGCRAAHGALLDCRLLRCWSEHLRGCFFRVPRSGQVNATFTCPMVVPAEIQGQTLLGVVSGQLDYDGAQLPLDQVCFAYVDRSAGLGELLVVELVQQLDERRTTVFEVALLADALRVGEPLRIGGAGGLRGHGLYWQIDQGYGPDTPLVSWIASASELSLELETAGTGPGDSVEGVVQATLREER